MIFEILILLTLAYDPFGRRIAKTIIKDEIGTDCTDNICPRTTNYVYDNQNIILEYNTSGDIQARYTHGINIDEPLAAEINNSGTTYYYHQDGLGSITALSDTNGNIVQTYTYSTFGNTTINGTIKQPFTFTAREYDTETGMYFYRARYYDPKVGRFVTKDPIGFRGGINQYAYVLNNPVNKTDPTGLLSCSAKCHLIALAESTPICHWMLLIEPGGVFLFLVCEALYHETIYDSCMYNCEKQEKQQPCKK